MTPREDADLEAANREGPDAGRPVALVTAGADGIGAAIVAALLDEGYTVVAADVDADALAARWTDRSPAVCRPVVMDATSPSAVDATVASVLDDLGRIDVLVNVVGGSRPGRTIVDLQLDEWERMLQLNLTTVYLLCHAVIPHMQRRGGGAVVNVSSGAGLRGMTANPAYVAAKAGVAALTRALAIDHGPHGVRVNCVAPGPVATPLMRRNRTPEEIEVIAQQALVGRVADPAEIAGVVAWLVGDAATYVMGQTIAVDGGVASGI